MGKNKKHGNNFNLVGKNIKKFRKNSNITQEALCARMQTLGFQLSRSDISKIETSKKFITDYELYGFSLALKVPISDFFEDITFDLL